MLAFKFPTPSEQVGGLLMSSITPRMAEIIAPGLTPASLARVLTLSLTRVVVISEEDAQTLMAIAAKYEI